MSRLQEFRDKVVRGTAWIGLASSMVALLDFAAFVILQKFFLGPEHLGNAVMALFLFPALDAAADVGLSSSLIQMEKNTPEKVSTVFWMSVAISCLLFGLLLVIGPAVGRFYGDGAVGWMLIAYGSKLLFQPFYAIPYALMKRELRFKELSVLRIIANLAEFAGKIGFAALGFRVWCFVLGPFCRVLVTGVGTQILHPFRPRLVFHWRDAGAYLRFGFKTSAHQILYSLYTNFDYAVVGAFFGKHALGLYRAAYELILEPVKFISDVVAQIAFPVFARLRRRRAELVEQFIAFTRQNLAVVVPVVAVILLEADDLLYLIAEDLTPAAGAARVLCAVGLLRSVSHMVPPLLDGSGRPGLTLAYTVVAAAVVSACFVLFAHFFEDAGYISVAYGWTGGYWVAFAVLLYLAVDQIGVPLIFYLRRILGIPLCTAVGFVAGAGVRMLLPMGTRPFARLLLVGSTTVLITFLLLGLFQGISPASVVRAVKGKRVEPSEDASVPPAA